MPLDGKNFVLPDERVRRGLRDAADYIEKHGWCQHTLEDDVGRVCAIGALNAVFGGYFPQRLRARSRIREVIKEDMISIWNNRVGRTQAEVVSALRKAAEI